MNNIILIGMAGCGKSTVGVVLAKMLGYDFLDSDLLIQNSEKRLLKDIIQQEGREGFQKIEENINLSIKVERTVIATGGSIVYCKKAMEYLKKEGMIIYIQLSVETITERLGDITGRGILMKDTQTISDLYDERRPLYEKYADLIFNSENLSICDAASGIKKLIIQRHVF